MVMARRQAAPSTALDFPLPDDMYGVRHLAHIAAGTWWIRLPGDRRRHRSVDAKFDGVEMVVDPRLLSAKERARRIGVDAPSGRAEKPEMVHAVTAMRALMKLEHLRPKPAAKVIARMMVNYWRRFDARGEIIRVVNGVASRNRKLGTAATQAKYDRLPKLVPLAEAIRVAEARTRAKRRAATSRSSRKPFL
jgi:hypothetical protein